MQVSRSIILYLPERFEIELGKSLEADPPSWDYKIEYFYYLIHYLTFRQIQNKDDKYFSMNTKQLKKLTVWNIDRYIKYLVNGEFLYRDDNNRAEM